MASTKVRGITIELGADTSGLSKALSGINKEIGSTSKQLKDVERLLKLDPTNTELLEQKHRLLSDQIGETKTKLEALKEAQKQVGEELQQTGKGQEQYDALQREIISCTQELKELEKQADRSSVAMQKISATGDALQKAGDKISGVGEKLMPLSAAAAGIGAGIIKTTADFDASMSKVAAVSGAAGDEFDALRDKAREMGATTKFTASDAAEAMNYMAMAGWKSEQMLSGIEGVMNLAAASGEDLATTSDIVTDALTAFGMQAEDSSRFADILASAASNANTNVSMMGESFKYVAPVAGSLGYSAEDVSIALGLMANSGIKASMAGTSLRNMFQRMAKPTKESESAMNRLGLALYDDEGKMYSFREIMDQLRESMGNINISVEEYDHQLDMLDAQLEDGVLTQSKYEKAVEELNLQCFGAEGAEKARAAAMLGGARAMSGLLAITNATEEDYEKLTEAIDNSSQAFARTEDGVMPLNEALASGKEILEEYSGSAEAMAAVMQDNASGQFEILKSQVQELAISLGDVMMPTIRKVIETLQGLLDYLNSLDEDQKETIVQVGLVIAAIGPLLVVIGKVTSGIGGLLKVIPMLVSPIGLVVAAVAGMIAIFVTLWETNEEFRNKVTAIWEDVKRSFQRFADGIVTRLNNLGFDFEDFGQVVKAIWEGICNFFAPMITNAFETVSGILDGALQVLTGLFDTFAGLFTGDWEQMWNGIEEIFSGIFEGIKSTFEGFINGITSKINWVTDKINSVSGGRINIGSIPQLAEGGVLTSGMAIVGEAGPELVQVSNGQAIVQPLNNSGDLAGLLETYLPYLAAGTKLVMDSGALVGSIAPDMNVALGTVSIRGGNR